MWMYRRIFTSIIACGLLLGGIYFIRLRVSDGGIVHRKLAPDFLPNVSRFRPSRVCSQRALVLVTSSASHAQRRQVIRETWAHPTVTQPLDISVAFGVGAADNDDVQSSLDWEAEIYGDMFQETSLDKAKSASSTVQLLKAARSACAPVPEFIMKTEDSVFVNIHSLWELLEILETYSSSNTMWCFEWNRKLDKMGSNDTWVVLRTTQINDEGHPKYCGSLVYLMTGRALEAIVRRDDVQFGKNMLPEDVYVTGVLANEAGTVLSLLGERFVFDDDRRAGVDAGKVAFAYFGDKFEDGTNRLWSVLVKEKLNDSRRSDVGL